MKYSLRNLIWFVIVVCLATVLVIEMREVHRHSFEAWDRLEKERRAQLRALHWELDRILGKGNWMLERDKASTLVVKRSHKAGAEEVGEEKGTGLNGIKLSVSCSSAII